MKNVDINEMRVFDTALDYKTYSSKSKPEIRSDVFDNIIILIEKSIDINSKDKHDNNVLMSVLKNEASEKTIKLLFNKNIVDINQQNIFGENALMLALKHKASENTIKLLFQKDILINAIDRKNNCALLLAIEKGATNDTIRFLIEKGADINIENTSKISFYANQFELNPDTIDISILLKNINTHKFKLKYLKYKKKYLKLKNIKN